MPAYRRRLTTEQRDAIIEARSRGDSTERVAARFGTTVTNVYTIVSNHNVQQAKVIKKTGSRARMIRDYQNWKKQQEGTSNE